MSNSNSLLLSLLTAIQHQTPTNGSSFADVNSFVVFRQASGVDQNSGDPVDYNGFVQALTQLQVPHTSGLARLAYGSILSMAADDTDAITFNHFRSFIDWGTKRLNMQDTLNLASTTIDHLERTKLRTQAALDRHHTQKQQRPPTPKERLQLTGRSTSRRVAGSTPRNGLQLKLTGRSTSRRTGRTGRPASARSARSTSRKVQDRQQTRQDVQNLKLFQDKMTSKYSTLRAAFR